MGVQTAITLQEAQKLFKDFKLKNLQKTTNGVIDTTYLLNNYVLKRYEREIDSKIQRDKALLRVLYESGLNVPLHIASSKEWHLYSRLKGSVPKTTCYFHIQALARFLASLHTLTCKQHQKKLFLEAYDITKMLNFTKQNYYGYYKKLQSLSSFTQRKDGFIHGDIFKDNTLFEGEKLGVFDFIDGGVGSFSFDIAVTLMAFNPSKRHALTRLFLNTYNQKAPKKVSPQELQKEMKNAAKLYGLLRIDKYKNTQKAKELANFW